MLDVKALEISDVKILQPRRFQDSRGFFVETWNKRRMAEHGFELDFVQDNMSLSRDVGTIRGLHYQAPPHGQGKLVSCPKGRIFDVAVDARKGSPTYGQWVGAELSDENGCLLWIPEGFLHGFVTREPDTLVAYKCTGFYEPSADGGVHWDSVGIDWGCNGAAGLSDKDLKATAFADWISPFNYEIAA